MKPVIRTHRPAHYTGPPNLSDRHAAVPAAGDASPLPARERQVRVVADVGVRRLGVVLRVDAHGAGTSVLSAPSAGRT
jgi:hypothetical protein